MDKSKALVILAIDGITTHECGIGVLVSWFFRAFREFEAAIPNIRDTAIYAIGPDVNPQSKDFRADLANQHEAVCSRSGGRLSTYAVSDNRSLSAAWGLADLENWKSACKRASTMIREIAALHEHTTVVVHGIMLANLRSYLTDCDNVTVSFVAHSLGMAGKDALAQQRMDWEHAGFGAIQNAPGDTVAFVSWFTRELLATRYGVAKDRLVPFLNGIWAGDPKFSMSVERRNTLISSFDIPTDKELTFSWGRCVPSKGFELIIDAWKIWRSRNPDSDRHLVLLMPAAVGASAYVKNVNEKCNALGRDAVTAIFEFSDELPIAMLRAPNLSSVIFASEFESYMLTAAEAIEFADPEVQHIYYDIPPVREQYLQMPNGHMFKERNCEQLADVLQTALPSKLKGTGKAPGFVSETKTYLQSIL